MRKTLRQDGEMEFDPIEAMALWTECANTQPLSYIAEELNGISSYAPQGKYGRKACGRAYEFLQAWMWGLKEYAELPYYEIRKFTPEGEEIGSSADFDCLHDAQEELKDWGPDGDRVYAIVKCDPVSGEEVRLGQD